jgi:DNA-binding CsgD family transcriptional regulator
LEVTRTSSRAGARRQASSDAPPLYGRDSEQQRIDDLIGEARLGRSGALLVRGEVGTGKTALLDYARSRSRGVRVLRCQGEQAESDLQFAVLHQLLRPVLTLAADLPERLARPLAAAMEGGRDGVPDRFLVGAAVLAVLALAAGERPLMCVVDDGQWLDRSSADVLSFVARRLGREGIVLLVASSDGEGRPFEPAGMAQVRLGGLDPHAAMRLLAERAGGHLVPEVARRLADDTGGLPLALTSAAAALTPAQLGARAPLPRPLPLGPRLREAFLRRVRRLPGPAQRMLLLVAAAGHARIDVVVAAAADLGIELPALEIAEAAGLVRIETGLVRFQSRLAAAAVYTEAPFFDRRAAHLALAAGLAEDDDSRAWHLAAAALTRDGGVAADLERAAERAGLRGDLATSADALQRAAQLTPDAPERGRRLAAAARARWLSGGPVQARELLDRVDLLRPTALVDADAAEVRGAIALGEFDLEGARTSLIIAADRVAEYFPDRALDLLIRAARVVVVGADAAGAEAVDERVLALAARGVAGAADLHGLARILAGDHEAAARLAARALEMAAAAGGHGGHLLTLVTALSAGHDLSPEHVAATLELLATRVIRLRTTGMVGLLPNVLARLARVQLCADQHRPALATATEGLDLARRYDQPWAEASCVTTLAMLAALRGDEEECAYLTEGLFQRPGIRAAAAHTRTVAWAAAVADLGACRFAEAQSRLEELVPGYRMGHAWQTLWSRPDAVEAAVRSGRPGPARAALEVLERAARPDWPVPAAALLARSRALLAGGREAERHFQAALALHGQAERPFQEARTRLLWAEHLRRNRRRVDAREQLRAALATFERLETAPWAARARAELRATGETVGPRDAERERLTPQERRIAELVADGGSNREVAERLFLSPRTVGYHLTRVYQKLGVSTRTRLARALREHYAGAPAEISGRGQPGLSGRARAAFRSHSVPEGALLDPTVPGSQAS